MSFSRIIKLHNLRSQRVVVDPRSFGPRQPMSPGEGGPQGEYYDDNVSDLMEGRRPLSWTVDVQGIPGPAREEVDAILAEARSRAEEIQLQAYEEGYQKGLAEGILEVKNASAGDIQRIAALAESAAVDMSRILLNSEEGIVLLALSLAEKIVHKNLAEERGLIAGMVRWALEQIDMIETLRVRVNPDDLEVLRPFWEDGRLGNGTGRIDLAPDPHVEMGGCIIETNSSVIDAQIKTKLAEIEQAFSLQFAVTQRDE